MKILYNEFLSLLSKRIFYLAVATVFILTILIIYISSKSVITPDGVAFSSSDYTEVQNMIMNTDNPRDYLSSQVQMLSEQHIVGKSSLYKLFLLQLDETENYKQYINSINENADLMGKSILVNDTNSFVYRNLQKTKADYNKLKGVTPVYTERNGVNLATTNISVDLLFLFLMMTIVILTITAEKPMLPLYKSTISGRRRLIVSKITLVIILCLILHTIMTVIIYVMSFSLFPVKDFSAPIQSVFMNAPLKITILQYLILTYTIRFFIYNLFIGIFMYLSVKTKQMLDALGIFALLMGVSAFLYISIPAYSFLNIFKYINLFFILKPSRLLYVYINLNFFGFPVTCLFVILAVIFLVFFLAAGITSYVFEQGKVIEKPLLRISINWIQVTSVNLFLHELWRLIIANKAVIIILFGLAMQLSHVSSYHLAITKEESYYYQAVEAAKQKDDPVEWAKEQLNALSAAGASNEQISAMNRLLVLLDYENNLSMQDENKLIVYDTPYKILLMDATERNAVNSLLIMVLILLCVLPVREQLFNKLFSATKNGRSKLLLVKSGMLLIVAGAIFVSVYLPEFVTICSTFNAKDFTAPIQLLMFLQTNSNIPIYLYLIMIYAIRLIVIAGISFIVMLFSKKGIYTTLILYSALFLLPALLNIFEIEFFRYYPSNWLLDFAW